MNRGLPPLGPFKAGAEVLANTFRGATLPKRVNGRIQRKRCFTRFSGETDAWDEGLCGEVRRCSEGMVRDIDVLNEEMEAAGARFFAGGLQSAPHAKSLRKQPGGEIVLTAGPYLETREHVGGFWILDAANMDEAVAWGRKAVVACRASVEVREFLAMPAK